MNNKGIHIIKEKIDAKTEVNPYKRRGKNNSQFFGSYLIPKNNDNINKLPKNLISEFTLDIDQELLPNQVPNQVPQIEEEEEEIDEKIAKVNTAQKQFKLENILNNFDFFDDIFMFFKRTYFLFIPSIIYKYFIILINCCN